MNEKRKFSERAKEWWINNRKAVKTGAFCGLIGLGYGFVKGMSASDKLWIKGLSNAVSGESEIPTDKLGLTEANCDDPELLELVKFENENS